jgi:hypothetical protein
MTTRRAFMQIAAAAAAPVALGGLPKRACAAAHQIVLFEQSVAPAQSFARAARSQGVTAHSIREGDVTDAWLRTLRPAWQRGPAVIAGLTTPPALFCLEQLAFAHGLRVVFHSEHMLLPDGGVSHHVQRAHPPVTAGLLDRAGSRWPQRLADWLLELQPRTGKRPGPSLAALQPTLPEGATLLASWIIA